MQKDIEVINLTTQFTQSATQFTQSATQFTQSATQSNGAPDTWPYLGYWRVK